MTIRLLVQDWPQRRVALATDRHILSFAASAGTTENNARASTTSLPSQNASQAQCLVEFSGSDGIDLSTYRSLSSLTVLGTLGLVAIEGDIYLCVVSHASKVATVRPGENVYQINAVDFREQRSPI